MRFFSFYKQKSSTRWEDFVLIYPTRCDFCTNKNSYQHKFHPELYCLVWMKDFLLENGRAFIFCIREIGTISSLLIYFNKPVLFVHFTKLSWGRILHNMNLLVSWNLEFVKWTQVLESPQVNNDWSKQEKTPTMTGVLGVELQRAIGKVRSLLVFFFVIWATGNKTLGCDIPRYVDDGTFIRADYDRKNWLGSIITQYTPTSQVL